MILKVAPKLPNSFQEMMFLHDEFCFQFSQNIIDQCLEYAKGKAPHNSYLHQVRNADPRKTFVQDSYSKLAEFAASEFFALYGKSYPVDTQIYAPSQKSWNADLGKKIAVKSTSLNMASFISRGTNGASRESWTFQFSNNNGRGGLDREIFGENNADSDKFCVFVTVEEEEIKTSTRVWVRGCWLLKYLFKYNLFKEPIKTDKKGLKKVIYDGDLKAYASKKISSESFQTGSVA